MITIKTVGNLKKAAAFDTPQAAEAYCAKYMAEYAESYGDRVARNRGVEVEFNSEGFVCRVNRDSSSKPMFLGDDNGRLARLAREREELRRRLREQRPVDVAGRGA
jgi:hypothetical protein